MARSWYILPDGSYEPLSRLADLLLDTQYTMEDACESQQALSRARETTRSATLEARRLVDESRRERRLRTTHLKLVRTPA